MIAVCLMLGSSLFLIPAMTASAATEEVTAIYPPWWSAAHVFTAAADDIQIVRTTHLPFVVIVRSSASNRLTRLRNSGALLLLNLGAASCGELAV